MTVEEELSKIKDFLQNGGNLAIIGASSSKGKAGYYVPKYLQSIGFNIFPVNPNLKKFLGLEVYKKLDDIEASLDGVVIYRRLPIAEKFALDAVERKIPVIWLPDNITSEEAKEKATNNGLFFVQNRCPLRDGRRLLN